MRGDDRRRLASDGVCLQDHQAERVGMYGTAGMLKAEVPDFYEAIGENMLEEPTDKLHSVEVGDSRACTARFTIREGDRAVLERNDAAVGDGDLEDRGGEIWERRVAIGGGLAVDVPVGLPDQWIDLR